MKNLTKLSRENLKNVKGGITPECAAAQASAIKCYFSNSECTNDPDSEGICIRFCNKYCY